MVYGLLSNAYAGTYILPLEIYWKKMVNLLGEGVVNIDASKASLITNKKNSIAGRTSVLRESSDNSDCQGTTVIV
jgi:hypothetical protein